MPRKAAEVPIGPVETIRHRLDMSLAEFSEALGFGASTYGDYVRAGKVTKTVCLAAEALMRRQAPAAEDELAFITRIVKGVPLVVALEETRTIILDDQRYLLVPWNSTPKEQMRPSIARPGNGADAHSGSFPADRVLP